MRICRGSAIGTEDREHELQDTSSSKERCGMSWPGANFKGGAACRGQKQTHRGRGLPLSKMDSTRGAACKTTSKEFRSWNPSC